MFWIIVSILLSLLTLALLVSLIAALTSDSSGVRG